MIPEKIKPYFETRFQAKDGENTLIEGRLTCCNSQDFEVFVVGEKKSNIFSKMCLFPQNDKLAMEVHCKKCGKIISVFDSECDGYEHCSEIQSPYALAKPIDCKKCKKESFSVVVRYEYPDIHELTELQIPETDNAFTWIWITLICNKCGARYKNFINYETA